MLNDINDRLWKNVSLKKFCVLAIVVIVSIFVLQSIYPMFRNVLVAQSRLEFMVALLILLYSLGGIALLTVYAIVLYRKWTSSNGDDEFRRILVTQVAEYMSEKLSLDPKRTFDSIEGAFIKGIPLSGKLHEVLLTTDLIVRKHSADNLEYELQLYTRIEKDKFNSVKITVPYHTSWSYAPSAFRDAFIRQRAKELAVSLYPIDAKN